MKTAKLFSIIFVLSTLLIGACTPKDVAVTDDKTRELILNQKNRRSGSKNSSKNSFRFGYYGINSLQTELAVEALEVLRLSLGSADASKTVYSKSADIYSEDKSSFKTSLTAEKVVQKYTNSLGDFDSSITKKWDVEVVTDGANLVSVVATAENSKRSYDQINVEQKTYLNFYEKTVTVKVERLASNLLQISIAGEGNLNAKVKDSPAKQNFNYNLKFEVNLEDLRAGKVQLQNTSFVYVDVRGNGRNWQVDFAPSGLEVNLDGNCNAVVGIATVGNPAKPKQMEFGKEGIEVLGTSFKATYAACGHRPTLDLSRLTLP